MEKNTRKMSKGNLTGIGVGLASLILSGCIIVSNEKKMDAITDSAEERIKEAIVISEGYKQENSLYKLKVSELTNNVQSLKEEKVILKNNLEEVKKQNKILKSKIEKSRIEKLKAQKKADNNKSNGVVAQKVNSSNYYETTMVVTAYTAGYESTQKKKGDKGYGLTASGAYVKEGRTIACPKSMSFGTVVELDGYGKRVCEDRGGAITNGHLDLYMDSLQKAQSFGRKTMKVKVFKS